MELLNLTIGSITHSPYALIRLYCFGLHALSDGCSDSQARHGEVLTKARLEILKEREAAIRRIARAGEEEHSRIVVGYRRYAEVLPNLGDESWPDWLAEAESRMKRAAA